MEYKHFSITLYRFLSTNEPDVH